MWKIKVLIQFFLSKLPGGEKLNHMLQKANKSHSESKTRQRVITLTKALKSINEQVPLQGGTVVEVGTGWSPINSILLYLIGVHTCHTYDHVRHVRYELALMLLRCIEEQLDEISKITSVPMKTLDERMARLRSASSLEDFFTRANIKYHAPGDASVTGLEDKSVDLVYSHAVLEHVPVQVVYDLTRESKRILKDTGCAYHLIGLHDHYTSFDKRISKVNFLKYPEFLWSFFVKNKISYHNRMREKQFLAIFEEYGANIFWLENTTDPQDVELLKTMKIDKRFQSMSHAELAIHQTEIMYRFS